jgi:hypothetical protein
MDERTKFTSMKAKQEDILIAEFMGWSYLHEINEFQDLVGQKFHKEVYYSTSWDWLMPVVEKIRRIASYDKDKFSTYVVISFDTKIYSGAYGGSKPHSNIYFNKTFSGNTSKEATYKAVVEFIKWHNENK